MIEINAQIPNNGLVSIIIDSLPTPTAGSNSPICEGVTLNLYCTPAGAISYNWSGPNGFTSTSQNPSIIAATIAASGTYTVTVTGTGGSATTTTAVTVNPNSIPIAGSNSPICEGESLNLTSTPAGPNSYSWSGPDGFSSMSQNPTIAGATPAASGTYTVTVTATGGCSATTTTMVTVNSAPGPVISINGNVITCTPPYQSYQWYYNGSPVGSSTQTIICNGNGNYYVSVTDNNTCSGNSNILPVSNCSAGISELNSDNDFVIYPVPANDNITIENAIINKDVMISAYTIQGQLLIQQPMLQAKTNIDIGQLVKGIYFVEVKTENGITIKKFIKD